MPRGRARALIYISLSPHLSTYPILPLCIPRPIRSTQVADSRRVARTASVRRENGDEGWFGRVASRREEAEDARDGPTSIKRGQEKCEEDREEPRVPRGGGRTAVAAVMAGGMA